MMRFNTLFLFCLLVGTISAQNNDSIQQLYKQAKDDSTRLKITVEIGKSQSINRIGYWDTVAEKTRLADATPYFKGRLLQSVSQLMRKQQLYKNAINYANSALDYFLVENKTKNICAVYNEIGGCYSAQSNFSSALSFYQLSLSYAQEHQDTLNVGVSKLKLSTLSYKKGDYPSALNYGFQALAVFKQQKDSSKMIMALKNIGAVYYANKDFKKSLAIGFQCLAITEKINNKEEQLSSLNNIGTVYSSTNQYSLALTYHLKGIKLAESEQILDEIAYLSSNLAIDYLFLKNYNKAIFYSEKTIAVGNELQDNTTIEHGLYTLGEIYFQQNLLPKAETCWIEAIEKGQKINDLEGLQLTHSALSKLYEKQNSFAKSLFHYKASVTARDSLYNETNAKKIVKAEMDYELQQKDITYKLEKEKISIESDKKNAVKNSILIAISALLIIILGIFYYVYRTNKQKQIIKEYEKNSLKQKLLVSQMNPHFIYNSIDNIQALIYNNENELAVNYLHHFSKLTRQIVEHSSETYIAFSDELNMIENYLKIQQLLHQNTFEYTMDIDESIDQDYTLVPPMLSQPFIENAIKHGLKGLKTKGQIDISFTLKNNILFFEITDNGKGFRADQTSSQHKSLAMRITQERLQNLSGKVHNTIIAENRVGDNGNILGAKIEFEIPYFYEK